MFKKWTFWGIALKVLLVVLLIAGGVSLYRAGYVRGYMGSAAVEGVEYSEIMSEGFHHGYGYAPYTMHHKGFFPGRAIGMLFGLFFFFMVFSGFRRMMWYRRCTPSDGPEDAAWMGHWHDCGHPFHYGPPWMRKPESSQEEEQQSQSED